MKLHTDPPLCEFKLKEMIVFLLPGLWIQIRMDMDPGRKKLRGKKIKN